MITNLEIRKIEVGGGIGYVRTMERVYPNEPHMAPVGEEPCPDCNQKEKDDFRCED